MDIELREARVDDADDIARLTEALGYRMGATTAAQRTSEARRDPSREVVVAVGRSVEGRPVVGWIELRALSVLASGDLAVVHGLVVDERHRGTGVGRALLERGVTWARDRGIERLRVRTRETRGAAHAFYEHLGFEHTKTQRVYDTRTSPGA